MSVIYYILIIVFVYYLSLFSGILSSLILRLVEKLILSQKSMTSLVIKRGIREGFISDNLADSSLNVINPILRFEDFLTGAVRGGLVAFAIFEFFGLIFDFESVLALFSIILGHLIIVLRNWRKNNRKSDEFFNWVGDFFGIVVVFSVYQN
jgi:hypothetical protein